MPAASSGGLLDFLGSLDEGEPLSHLPLNSFSSPRHTSKTLSPPKLDSEKSSGTNSSLKPLSPSPSISPSSSVPSETDQSEAKSLDPEGDELRRRIDRLLNRVNSNRLVGSVSTTDSIDPSTVSETSRKSLDKIPEVVDPAPLHDLSQKTNQSNDSPPLESPSLDDSPKPSVHAAKVPATIIPELFVEKPQSTSVECIFCESNLAPGETVTLSCSHSCCLTCKRNLSILTGISRFEIYCSLCEAKVFPVQSPSLPEHSATEAKKCENCELQNASIWCDFCCVQFCSQCDLEIHSSGAMKKHSRSAIQTHHPAPGISDLASLVPFPCPNHTDHSAEFFCQSCRDLLCQLCFSNHSQEFHDHAIETTHLIFDQYRQDLRNAITQSHRCLVDCHRFLTSLDRVLDLFDSKRITEVDQCKLSIESRTQVILETLHMRRVKLEEEVKEMVDRKVRQITREKDRLASIQERCEELLQQLDKDCSISSRTDQIAIELNSLLGMDLSNQWQNCNRAMVPVTFSNRSLERFLAKYCYFSDEESSSSPLSSPLKSSRDLLDQVSLFKYQAELMSSKLNRSLSSLDVPNSLPSTVPTIGSWNEISTHRISMEFEKLQAVVMGRKDALLIELARVTQQRIHEIKRTKKRIICEESKLLKDILKLMTVSQDPTRILSLVARQSTLTDTVESLIRSLAMNGPKIVESTEKEDLSDHRILSSFHIFPSLEQFISEYGNVSGPPPPVNIRIGLNSSGRGNQATIRWSQPKIIEDLFSSENHHPPQYLSIERSICAISPTSQESVADLPHILKDIELPFTLIDQCPLSAEEITLDVGEFPHKILLFRFQSVTGDGVCGEWSRIYSLQTPREFQRIFPFVNSPFDDNGFLYWAGRDAGRSPIYCNPHVIGQVAVTMSTVSNSPHIFVNHAIDSSYCITHDRPLQWICVDIGPNRYLHLTHYCLRTAKGEAWKLRNWELQGKVSPKDLWVILKKHKNCQLLSSSSYSTASWAINYSQRRRYYSPSSNHVSDPSSPTSPSATLSSSSSFSTTTAGGGIAIGDEDAVSDDLSHRNAYRYFRILQTGLNSSRDHYLVCNGIELYGVLHTPQTEDARTEAEK